MKISRILKYVAIGIIAILIISMVIRLVFQNRDPITFELTLPAHTPDADAIILHIQGSQFQMTRQSDTLYTYELSYTDFEDQQGEKIGYGYSRGGFMPFAEYGLYNFQYIRTFKIEGGSNIKDTVERWKWFPVDPLDEPLIETVSDTFPVADRNEYWKGVLFADFWTDEWELQYNATILHLKEQGIEWIALAPPWDFNSVDLPSLSDADVQVPSYPEDKLRNHIRIFKDAGFKVHLSPQVCCTPVNTTNRDETWWNTWYSELKRFYKFHVDIAIEEGVDAMEIGPTLFGADLPLNPDLPNFINGTEKWLEILEIAKSAEIPIGFGLSTFSALWEIQPPWLSNEVNFYNELDYIGISLWSELVDFQNPTQDNFNYAMERIFQQVDIIHNQTGLPVVFTQVSYPSHTGAGLEIGPETALLYEDPDLTLFEYNPFEQAMIYEAFMRGVANRSYIQGSFPFGYWYIDAPLTVDDPSIRGKMAEIVYSSWLERLPDNQITQNLENMKSFNLKIDLAVSFKTCFKLTYQSIFGINKAFRV